MNRMLDVGSLRYSATNDFIPYIQSYTETTLPEQDTLSLKDESLFPCCRLTAPGEWFVHKFVMSPQNHTFPDAPLSRQRSAVRVTLSSLPRTSMTPYEISVASRDQLFAVKDASPLLKKSRRYGMVIDKPSPQT